jgi:hypothetical protein
VLTDAASFGLAAAGEASSLCTRFNVLLDALAKVGCFFLRRGAIENYYRISTSSHGKPEHASAEAAGFDASDVKNLKRDYESIVSALSHIAPNQRVDEDQLLRPKLGAVLVSTFLSMDRHSSDGQLNALARRTIGADAEVFKLINRSTDEDLRIEVQMASPLFQRSIFPFETGRDDNPNVIVPRNLPGTE